MSSDQPKGYSDPRWEKYHITPEHSEAVFDLKCDDAYFFINLFCGTCSARYKKDFMRASGNARDENGRFIEDNRFAKFSLAFRRENAQQFPLRFLFRHNIWTTRIQRIKIAEHIKAGYGMNEGYDLDWFINHCELLQVGQEPPQREPEYKEWVA